MESISLVYLSDECVNFCELVTHPGGHDGGEFPQYHYFTADGYETTYPESPTDTFCDEDVEDYFAVSNKEEARRFVVDNLKEIGLPESVYAGFLKALDESETFEVKESQDGQPVD